MKDTLEIARITDAIAKDIIDRGNAAIGAHEYTSLEFLMGTIAVALSTMKSMVDSQPGTPPRALTQAYEANVALLRDIHDSVTDGPGFVPSAPMAPSSKTVN